MRKNKKLCAVLLSAAICVGTISGVSANAIAYASSEATERYVADGLTNCPTWETFIQNPEIVMDSYGNETILADQKACESLEEVEKNKDLLTEYYDAYFENNANSMLSSSVTPTLNSTFTYCFSELQKIARTYVDSLEDDGAYDYDSNDEFYGMKDIWYSFYLFRYMKAYVVSKPDKSYMNYYFELLGGSEQSIDGKEIGAFDSYVKQQDPSLYLGLKSLAEGNIKSYSTSTQTLDLTHLAASMTVYLYSGERSSISEIIKYNDVVHDNFACWAGDLQQLINNAYVKTYTNCVYSTMHDAIYDMMGDEAYTFGLEDFYTDADAVNLHYVIDAYRVNNKTSIIDMNTILTAYYSNWETHVQQFLNTLWYEKIYYYTSSTSLCGFSLLDNKLTDEERVQVTLGFIDFCEDAFDVSINMVGYQG